jgi:malate synthase
LTDVAVPGGAITEAGVRLDINVALRYLDSWLGGTGAAAINDLMEDVATAEISRSQLWQWRRHRSATAEGEAVDVALLHRLLAEELAGLGGREQGRLGVAAELLYGLVMNEELAEFLTLDAYRHLP